MSDDYSFDGGADLSGLVGQEYANNLNQFDPNDIDPNTGLPYNFNGLQNQTASQMPPAPPVPAGMGAGTPQQQMDPTNSSTSQPYGANKSSVLKNVSGVVDALMKSQQKSGAAGGGHMGGGGELQGNLPGSPLAQQPVPQPTGYQAAPNRQPYGGVAGIPQIPF